MCRVAWAVCGIAMLEAGAARAQTPAAAGGSGGGSPAAAGVSGGGSPAAAVPERLRLSTSDGVQLAAWYYAVGDQAAVPAVAPGRRPPPVAIVVHDLEGSHATLEPLSLALQQEGVAVVAVSLRGHGTDAGNSQSRMLPNGRTAQLAATALRKPDFEAMARSSGGRVREQAIVRGDLETVHGWIKQQADAGVLDIDRLFLVGSGAGAAVAMAWTVEDAAWPPLATGPQGGRIRGLVLVSPAWTTRGFSIAPALGTELIRRRMPLVVIAGREDRDALKLFDQLKRQRPQEWYERRAGQKPESTTGKDASPTLYLFQLSTTARGDALAALEKPMPEGRPADLIAGFILTIADKAAEAAAVGGAAGHVAATVH
jgi:pimeloyl-ACP methyl ester carboxylesterase